MNDAEDPVRRFVRSSRIRFYAYAIGISVAFLFMSLALAPNLGFVPLLGVALACVLLGEWWFARVMRRGSTLVWSDGPDVAPATRFEGLGFRLVPKQPSAFGKVTIGRPFVWVHDTLPVVALERDVSVGAATRPQELVFWSFLDPGHGVLSTCFDTSFIVDLSPRLFVQTVPPGADPAATVQLHVEALRRLERAGLRPRPVDGVDTYAVLKEFAPRLPSLSGMVGGIPTAGVRRRLRRPVWKQRQFGRRLRRCLGAASIR